MGEPETEETPWALVKRLRAEGAPFATIVTQLQQRGLSREDLELLLKDEPEMQRTQPKLIPEERPSAALELPTISTGVGSSLRWGAITLAATLGAVGCAAAGGGASWGGLLALGSAGAFGGLLWSELRTGVRRTLRKLGYVAFFVGMLPTLGGFIQGWPPWTIGFAVAFAFSVPLLIWASKTGEKLRGLRQFAPKAEVFELNDVQFVVASPERIALAPGETAEVVLLAQNCVDADRELLVELGGDTHAIFPPHAYVFPLMPGCVVEFRLPLRLQPLAPEYPTVLLNLAARGAASGPRVRLAKGVEWVAPSAAVAANLLGAAALLTIGFGTFRLGSNGAIRLKCDPSKPFIEVPTASSTRTLYRPTADELKAAGRS